MPSELFEQLYAEGLISGESMDRVNKAAAHPVQSLQKDLKIFLYSGVLLLSSGLAIFVYRNIDAIGHLAILCILAAVCLFSYGYGLVKSPAFTWGRTDSPDAFYDYLLVLGGLTLVTLAGYLQFQYHLFGETWNLTAFIPMVILFATAYYFDHIGVLGLAIVNLAAWLGITINRLKWPFLENIEEDRTIYAAICLGVFLLLLSHISRLTKLKPHFANLYHQFGTHIFFISCLVAMFHFDTRYWPWLILLLAGSVYHGYRAFRETSFYYIVVALLYGYFGISYLATDLIRQPGFSELQLLQYKLIYFILSAALLAWQLLRINNTFKKNAGIRQNRAY